jgi:pimeloyl-ACP methyl ester carboxylesterase
MTLASEGIPADACDSLIEFAKSEVIQTPEFVARQAIVSLNDTDLRDRCADIRVPTLVICGEEDPSRRPRSRVR